MASNDPKEVPLGENCILGYFRNTECLILGAAVSFSRYLVHLMPIGTILNKNGRYLDLPHRL